MQSPESGPPGGKSPELPSDFDINRPQRGARDGYFYLWIELNKQYGEIINTMPSGRYDPRLKRKVRQMIATVVDDNVQLKCWNMFEGAIHNINNDTTLKTTDERNEVIMDICDIVVGQIWSFYDQFMGVSHRLLAGNAKAPASTAEQDLIDSTLPEEIVV